MGNSLEQYRQRIGSYQFSGTKQRRMYQSDIYNSKLLKNMSNQSGRKSNLKEVSYCLFLYIIVYLAMENLPDRSLSISTFSQNQRFHDPCICVSSNSNFIWVSSKERNKLSHSLEGNRRNLGYKYFAWICDRGFLKENKLADLKCFAY